MVAAASNNLPTERNNLDSTSSSTASGIIGVDSSRSAQAVMEVLEAALAEMAAEVAGIASDAGDGTARVDREVEKRFQQVWWEGEVSDCSSGCVPRYSLRDRMD